MMLSTGFCNPQVRLGGFGPMAGPHLASCFDDMVLIPIPNILIIILGLPIVLLSRRPSLLAAPAPRSRLVVRILNWLYYVLVFAALLMAILEITRLALSHSGIGLLPIALAGLLCAMALLWMRARRTRSAGAVGGVLLVYWALLLAFQSAKVDTLVYVEKLAKAAGSRGPSKYPNSDKSLDNYVILGLYAVFFLYELVRLATGKRGGRKYQNPSDGEDLVGHGGKEARF